jgi:hypothetical protein
MAGERYDRELIARMLTTPTVYGPEVFKEQARLLREADNAEAAGVQTVRMAGDENEWFPLLGTPFAMRWNMLNEEQAKRIHGQSLERLAQRGGLSPSEAMANVERRAFHDVAKEQAFRALIAAAPAPEAACNWSQEDDESDCWVTSCGNAFSLNDGTPSENSIKHCCYCGRHLTETRWEPESDEEDLAQAERQGESDAQ